MGAKPLDPLAAWPEVQAQGVSPPSAVRDFAAALSSYLVCEVPNAQERPPGWAQARSLALGPFPTRLESGRLCGVVQLAPAPGGAISTRFAPGWYGGSTPPCATAPGSSWARAEEALRSSLHGFRYIYGGAPTRRLRRLARAVLAAKKESLRARDKESAWQLKK